MSGGDIPGFSETGYGQAMLKLRLLLPCFILLAACTTTRRDGSPEVQTTSQANRESLQGAVAAPLRDINVLRTKIPEVLLVAMADPYALPQPLTCSKITALILPLNGALGADLDEEAVDGDDLIGRGKSSALGFVAGAASGVIPFRGWVRKLTGAERHDSYVQDAITAGGIRRGYLKGLGEAKGCRVPAAPARIGTAQEVIDQSGKPRFPIR